MTRMEDNMTNFAVGPVQFSKIVHAIGAQDVPYCRTAEFSAVMHENERPMQRFVNPSKSPPDVFITSLVRLNDKH